MPLSRICFLLLGIHFFVFSQAEDQAESYLKRALEIEHTYPDSAFILANKALVLAKESGNNVVRSECCFLLGTLFYAQGIFPRATEYLLEAQSLYASLNNQQGVAIALLHLGKVKYYVHDEKEALVYFNEALEQFYSQKDSLHIAEALGEIGHVLEKAKQYDSSKHYQNRALILYSQLNHENGKAHILENLGSIEEDLEQYDQAKEYFLGAAMINRRLKNEVELVSNLNNLGDVFRKTNQADSALVYSAQALELAEKHSLYYQMSSALRDMGKLYEQKGELKKALAYHERSRLAYDEAFSIESSRQLAMLHTLYDVELMNSEISRLKSNEKAERLQRVSISVSAIFLVIIGVVFSSRQRLKIRQNQQLIEQNEKLHKAEMENVLLKEEQLTIELKHKQLQERHLTLELETQQKSLGGKMLQIIEKNTLLENVKENLDTIKDRLDEKFQPRLTQLIKEIDTNIQRDKAWEEFQKSFEKIYEDFFEKLKSNHANLSANDLKICALMRVNLNSNEIAQVLGISFDSLRVARYRLRKKLGIGPGSNLGKYILSI